MTDTLSLSDVLGPDETEDDLIHGAVMELSATFGWPYERTWEAVRQRAGGERDPQSLAMALTALYADALGEGQEPGQELALAADSDDDGDQDQDVAASYYQRDVYTDGYYTGDEAALDEAALTTGSGDEPMLEGGWPARRAAAAYATQESISSQADVDVVGLLARNPRLGQFFRRDLVALAAQDADGGYVRFGAVDELAGDDAYQTMEDAHTGSEVERLSMLNDDLKGGLPKGIGSIHDSDMPRGGKRPHGSRHTRWCGPGCSRDHAQPADGGHVHPEVARLLDMTSKQMGGNRERPHGANTTHRPLRPDELHRARRAAAGRSAGKLTS